MPRTSRRCTSPPPRPSRRTRRRRRPTSRSTRRRARARRSRGRLLRDREGHEQEPAQLAQEIAAAFQPNELLASRDRGRPVRELSREPRRPRFAGSSMRRSTARSLPRTLGAGETICIDYGSPNISKHLAYHHIRGTTIGHALAQTFRALGYRVVGINFLGDWGTTHGMVIAAYEQWGPTVAAPTIELLNELYMRYPRDEGADRRRDGAARGSSGSRPASPKRPRCGSGSATSRGPSSRTSTRSSASQYDDLNGESFFWRDCRASSASCARARACSSRARARRSSSCPARRRRSC